MNIEKQIEKFFVSHTKLDTYKTCPMQYKYKYLMRLEKKISGRRFYIGADIHKLIELFYLHKTPHLLERRVVKYKNMLSARPQENTEDFKKWQEKVKESWEDTLTWREYVSEVIYDNFQNSQDGLKAEIGFNYVEDIIKIMGQYEYYYLNDNMKVLDLEHKKYDEMGIYNGKQVVLTYITDGVVQINNENYLIEHKTFSSTAMTFEETWLNVQTAEYVTALNKEGWEIVGVVWDNIKSKAPEKLNVLKSGLYGKQSQGRTLFSLIDISVIMKGPEAVIEEVEKVKDTAVSLEIDKNYDFFLSRHITRFSDNAVKAIRKDTDEVINVITKDEVPIYRNMGWASCNYCPFKDLCSVEMLGNDPVNLIDTLYERKGEK